MKNMNFTDKVVIGFNDQEWAASPAKGVWRKPLARENKEQGHATSLVKFEAGAEFPLHDHPGGEEIFVLEGVFSDESGDYPAGSYLRNPAGFMHVSYSKEGCLIFVKLCQFSSNDKQQVSINTNQEPWLPGQGGLKVMPLHEFEGEHTALVKWPEAENFQLHKHYGGEEILVLSGEFKDEHGAYSKYSWLRSPHMSQHHPFVDEETIIWVKVGHLLTVN